MGMIHLDETLIRLAPVNEGYLFNIQPNTVAVCKESAICNSKIMSR